MPSLRYVERQIANVEGFRVAFLHHDGRDVRGDMQDVPAYTFDRRLADDRSVSDWVSLRFRERYRGFDVAVLHRDGRRAHGNTLLRTLRAEY